MSVRAEIEEVLARRHGRRFCVLANRGTTALAASFHSLGRPGAGVVFPAAMCSIPVFAAAFAGMRPLFADVDPSTGNFDLADLERLLSEEKPAAVVPVHMFGLPEEVETVSALAAGHGASVVEDVALSMGAERGGRPTGAWGRLSALSFVRKMIPLEMGGAVLTDEPALAEKVRAFVDGLPPLPSGHLVETPAAMRAFHALTGYVAAGGWRRRELLAPFEAEFRRLLLARTVEEDWAGSIVLRELDALPGAVGARRVRAEVYDGALGHPLLKPLRREGSCLFAYPVRLDGLAAEDLLAFGAARGFSFKRLSYPDVAPVFGDDRPRPGAALMEREVIGFPVDDDRPVSDFWDYAGDFVRLLEDYVAELPSRPPFDGRGKLELRMAVG